MIREPWGKSAVGHDDGPQYGWGLRAHCIPTIDDVLAADHWRLHDMLGVWSGKIGVAAYPPVFFSRREKGCVSASVSKETEEGEAMMAERLVLVKRQRVACQCATCRSYCMHVPGWFLPHEIPTAAKALALTEEAFFQQRCTLDFWAGDTVFVIRPKTDDEPGGQVAAVDPRGECALYVEGQCSIHQVKPYECAVTSHSRNPGAMHQEVADAWREPKAVALVRRLYGSEPVEPEYDMFDVLSLLLGRR